MNEMVSLALAWAAGVLLGTMFFGGLWWTVHEGVYIQKAGAFLFRQPGGPDGDRLGRILFGFRAGLGWGFRSPPPWFFNRAPDRDPPHPKG